MNREECKFEPHDIGRQLAQHVVGMKPTSIGELPKEEVQHPSSETEPKIEEKNEQQKVQLDDSETRLLYQEFLMKPDSRVIDFLKEHKVEVIDFIRLECGEKIDNEPE
jgi:elongation factor Ts